MYTRDPQQIKHERKQEGESPQSEEDEVLPFPADRKILISWAYLASIVFPASRTNLEDVQKELAKDHDGWVDGCSLKGPDSCNRDSPDARDR